MLVLLIACITSEFLTSSALSANLNHFDSDKFLDSLHTLEEFRGITKRDISSHDRQRHERKKRSYCPKGTPKIRKEIRQLTDWEWREFVNAINAIKLTGEYDRLARIHRGRKRISRAHGGPNFLGWHRIYLLALEELLRRAEPCVTIPYWDSTLDYALDNSSWTVLFTEHFVGNGNGYVRTGPFNNWITGEGDRLARNTGAAGSLATDSAINDIFSKTRHAEITSMKTQFRNYSIENMHGGTHMWTNGQMAVLPSATEDPAFFLLHSFVDCLWLWWTEKNNIRNPYHDYPNITGEEAPGRLMDPWSLLPPLANITNREAYLPLFIQFKCHPRPTCSKSRPNCESKYLYCNTTTEKCVSSMGDYSRTGPPNFSERPPIRKGLKFESTFIDPRVRNDPLPQLLPENDPEAKAAARSSWPTRSRSRKPIPKHMILR